MRQGWFPTRSSAQEAIRAGQVQVGQVIVRRPGRLVPACTRLALVPGAEVRASRGAGKLEAAIDRWGVDPTGWRVADIGASTGGFTETWLQHGAERVYAVDVGHGQLRPWLAKDPRVAVADGVNARDLAPAVLASADRAAPAVAWEPLEAASIDVSFIGLDRVLAPVAGVVQPGGLALALLKPQFEVGPGHVGKGGVVREREAVGDVLRRYHGAVAAWGWAWTDVMLCPVPGREGNREFWLRLARLPAAPGGRPAALVEDVLAEAYGPRDGVSR